MIQAFAIFGIAILFYLLGKSADAVVDFAKKISDRIGIRLAFLGLLIGFLCALPEFSIGINATIQNTQALSFGNLIGSIFVIFGLILGISLILNRRIATNNKLRNIFPIVFYVILPLLLGLDGSIGFGEGAMLIVAYFFLLYFLYTTNKHHTERSAWTISNTEFFEKIFILLAGIGGIIISSNLIVRLTLFVLESFHVPQFVVGILFFSLGTNLPEFIVTIRAWQKHIRELSLGNLIGSAIAHSFIIGILAVMKTIPVEITPSYYVLTGAMFALLAMLVYFYESGKNLTRREGYAFIAFYVVFVVSQLLFFV